MSGGNIDDPGNSRGSRNDLVHPPCDLFSSFLPPPSLVVVELKYDLDGAEWAETIANRLPLRLARCSKYVLGIEKLNLTG